MSFSENLQFLRDRAGLTQEALAERLEVTRQSVSKWESGGSFPEMEKLLQLCDLFGTDLDTLLRGDVSHGCAEEAAEYDAHMDWFSKMIAGGVGLVLLGVAVMSLLYGLGLPEAVGVAALLASVAAAVVLFIVAGIMHSGFEEDHPVLRDLYTKREVDAFRRRFAAMVAASVAAILVDVACMGLFSQQAEAAGERAESLLGAFFFLGLAAAVSVLVWAGIQWSKYDLKEWNREHDPSPAAKRRRSLIGKVCGTIMLLATAVYLAIGFGYMPLAGTDYAHGSAGWEWGWIVYPVAGVLCGIAALLLGRDGDGPEDD